MIDGRYQGCIRCIEWASVTANEGGLIRKKDERRKEKGRCSFTDCLLASCGRASAPGRFRQVALCNLCASRRAAFTCMCCTHPRRLLRIVPRTGAPELIFRVPWLDSSEKQWLANWLIFLSTRFWLSEMSFLYSFIQLCLFMSPSTLSIFLIAIWYRLSVNIEDVLICWMYMSARFKRKQVRWSTNLSVHIL